MAMPFWTSHVYPLEQVVIELYTSHADEEDDIVPKWIYKCIRRLSICPRIKVKLFLSFIFFYLLLF